MACCTEVIFSASSSGISHSNSSSNAITSSTVSRESAPRSLTKEDSFLTSDSFTPNCSATIFLTRCSMDIFISYPVSFKKAAALYQTCQNAKQQHPLDQNNCIVMPLWISRRLDHHPGGNGIVACLINHDKAAAGAIARIGIIYQRLLHLHCNTGNVIHVECSGLMLFQGVHINTKIKPRKRAFHYARSMLDDVFSILVEGCFRQPAQHCLEFPGDGRHGF